MSTKTATQTQDETQEARELAEDTTIETVEQGLVPVTPTPLALQDSAGALGVDAGLMAELEGEINTLLKSVSVGEFTSPTSILGRNLTLTDAFPYEITVTENGQRIPKPLIIQVVTDDEGKVMFVAQARNSVRDRFIEIYSKIEQRNALSGRKDRVAFTNVSFQELRNLKPIAGNYPIGLQFTPATKMIPYTSN